MANTTPQISANPPKIPGLELLEPLGEGGMSVVYRGVHQNLQRQVAVKVLRAPTDEGVDVPAWLRESRLMASLAHTHVVAIHDAGQTEGQNYLVMEYMAGGSLRERMRPGEPWAVADAAPLLDSIAQALEHIHGQGVLHLDLKPENVLYTAGGQIKISDFGLSLPNADACALRGGRGFQGTLDYCAPELRCGLAVDERYDVFSLATLAYELLTSRIPGRVYQPATEHNPRLPAALDEVLRRGLARDPEERHASIPELRQALARACAQTPARAPHRLFVVFAVVAAVVLAVALAAWAWKPGAREPAGFAAPESSSSESSADQPDRLVVLYDQPDDLAMLAGDGGEEELSRSSDVTVERVLVEKPPRNVPPGLPLPVWPTPRPVLVVHSPGAWGFVHPLVDRTLARRVVKHWPALLRAVVPPAKNLVKAGGFDGDCLASNHGGALWRTGNAANWTPTRQITLDRPPGQPGNPTLRLTNLDPDRGKTLLGCYQPLAEGPPPGALLVLRYRARSQNGQGCLAVYAGMPVVLPERDTGAAARRIRAAGAALPPEPSEPASRWLYRSPAWVTPARDWQTYLVIWDSPPYPTRALHRNLVIDLAATHPSAIDQVWVDDVELFVWEPVGSEP